MSVRPYQRLGEVTRDANGRPFNIHLWVVKECDRCGFTQRFAAGAASTYNVKQQMQRDYYCRDCQHKQQESGRVQQRLTAAVQQGGAAD